MKKEDAIKKINTMGKAGQIVTNILKVFWIISIISVLAAGIVCYLMPKDSIQMSYGDDASISINLNDFDNNITTDKQQEALEAIDQINKNALVNVQLNNHRYGLASMDVLNNIVSIDLSATDPRSITIRDISYSMFCLFGTLSLTLIILFFIGGLCKAVRYCQSPFEEKVIRKMNHLAYCLIPACILSSIFSSFTQYLLGSSDALHFKLNLNSILIALVVLGLSFIFKYGAVLQQESDETL